MQNTKAAMDGMLAGKSTREIAEELQLSPRHVNDLIEDALKEAPPLGVAAWRNSMIEQAQSVIAANWPHRHKPQNAKIILAATKMIGDVVGAFAPKEVNVSGEIVTIAAGEELIARLARLAGEDPEVEVTVLPPEENGIHRRELSGDVSGQEEEDPQEPES